MNTYIFTGAQTMEGLQYALQPFLKIKGSKSILLTTNLQLESQSLNALKLTFLVMAKTSS